MILTLHVSAQVPHTSDTVEAQTALHVSQVTPALLVSEYGRLRNAVDAQLKERTQGGLVRLMDGRLVVRKG